MENQIHFPHLQNNILLSLLREPEFAAALVYMVDYKHHQHLNIIPKTDSIELSNEDVTVAVIIYSGFELEEYAELKNRKNLHLVCLSDIILKMCEFEHLYIKHIDKMVWFFSIIVNSKQAFVSQLNQLKNLNK